jgi:ElaB/YqjD/DUF883 family membrane-anchored ribosome-binding protein
MNATYKNTTKDAGQGIAAAADHLADTVREGGKTAVKVAEDATATARQSLADAGTAARDLVDSVKDTAEEAVEDGRSRLGGALRKTALQRPRTRWLPGLGLHLHRLRM